MAFGRRLVAAVVCVPLLVVGGCADDPKPKLAPPDDAPTSAASSPSATRTAQPWEKKTKAGAVAFAKHWIDVFNEAARTGDTRQLRTLGATSCESCSNFAKVIDAIYANGGKYESEGWRVLQTSRPEVQPAGTATVDLRIHQAPERITRPGEPVERNEAATVTYSAELGWEGDGWLMGHLYFMS